MANAPIGALVEGGPIADPAAEARREGGRRRRRRGRGGGNGPAGAERGEQRPAAATNGEHAGRPTDADDDSQLAFFPPPAEPSPSTWADDAEHADEPTPVHREPVHREPVQREPAPERFVMPAAFAEPEPVARPFASEPAPAPVARPHAPEPAPAPVARAIPPEPAPAPAPRRVVVPPVPVEPLALPSDSGLVLIETDRARAAPAPATDDSGKHAPAPRRTRPPRVEQRDEPLQMVETRKDAPPTA